jgi:hypothetical protein
VKVTHAKLATGVTPFAGALLPSSSPIFVALQANSGTPFLDLPAPAGVYLPLNRLDDL